MGDPNANAGDQVELAESSESRPAADCFEDPRYCRTCAYNLQGLPCSGQCPECSADYTSSIVRPRPVPSALSICLRFGWPILAILGLWIVAVVVVTIPGGDAFMVVVASFVSLAFIAVMLVNAIVMANLFAQQYATLEEREKPLGIRLYSLSRLASVLFHLLVIVPGLLLGGCLLLLLSVMGP